MQTGRCLRIYAGHFGPITALAISPNGQFVAGAGAGGGGGGVIRIWEISSGKEVALLTGKKDKLHIERQVSDGVSCIDSPSYTTFAQVTRHQ